eukprot:1551965-Ditylum_brightwellii.AAC.1
MTVGNISWTSFQFFIAIAIVGPSTIVGFGPSFQFREQTTFRQRYPVFSFLSPRFFYSRVEGKCISRLLYRHDDEDDDGDDESDINIGDEDWRDFRAKLVMQKNDNANFSKKLDASAFLDEEEDMDGFGALFSQMDTGSKSVL